MTKSKIFIILSVVLLFSNVMAAPTFAKEFSEALENIEKDETIHFVVATKVNGLWTVNIKAKDISKNWEKNSCFELIGFEFAENTVSDENGELKLVFTNTKDYKNGYIASLFFYNKKANELKKLFIDFSDTGIPTFLSETMREMLEDNTEIFSQNKIESIILPDQSEIDTITDNKQRLNEEREAANKIINTYQKQMIMDDSTVNAIHNITSTVNTLFLEISDRKNNRILQQERQKRKEELKNIKHEKRNDTKNASDSQSSFTPIKQKLNINCANGDLEELINYLEKEVPGFDRETVSLTSIQKTSDSESYDIFFHKKYNGFTTYYYVYVVVEEQEGLKYYSNLHQFQQPKENIINCSEISQEVIEKAKKEAIKNIDLKSSDVIESQNVAFKINVDLKPFISITSHIKEQKGTYFSKSFIYYI